MGAATAWAARVGVRSATDETLQLSPGVRVVEPAALPTGDGSL